MTIAAMRVLPRPVGRATMVLVNSAVLVMDNWYWRQGILAAQNRNTDIKYKGHDHSAEAVANNQIRESV